MRERAGGAAAAGRGGAGAARCSAASTRCSRCSGPWCSLTSAASDRRRPDAHPEEVIRILERRFLAAVTTGGAAVERERGHPRGRDRHVDRPTGVETLGFLEASALFAQSVAEVHGIPVEDPGACPRAGHGDGARLGGPRSGQAVRGAGRRRSGGATRSGARSWQAACPGRSSHSSPTSSSGTS